MLVGLLWTIQFDILHILKVLVTKDAGKIKVHLATDSKKPLTLHWALSRTSEEWSVSVYYTIYHIKVHLAVKIVGSVPSYFLRQFIDMKPIGNLRYHLEMLCPLDLLLWLRLLKHLSKLVLCLILLLRCLQYQSEVFSVFRPLGFESKSLITSI